MMKMMQAVTNIMNFADLYSFFRAIITTRLSVISKIKLKKKKNILSIFIINLLFLKVNEYYYIAERKDL